MKLYISSLKKELQPMAQANVNQVNGVNLSDVFKRRNVEMLTFVTDKEQWATEKVVFCITDIKRVPVTNPQFNQVEQWLLTVTASFSNGTSRRYLLPIPMNETRDDVLVALQEELATLPENGRIIHGVMLEAIPMKKYEHPFYIIVPASSKELQCQCAK